jgi:hypothetical protein
MIINIETVKLCKFIYLIHILILNFSQKLIYIQIFENKKLVNFK